MDQERESVDTSPTRLKVLDLGTQVAGPFVATLLGDLGAEVIKVEQPGVGDSMREGGAQSRWPIEGRNKRSISLNLRVPKGQDLLRRLVPWADILVENFRPGTMGNWGLSYDELSDIHPGLVYVSVSGYGQDGPYSGRAGYDYTAAAFGGMTYLTGYADRPPLTSGVAVVDYGTAAFAAVGALEAIRQRDCGSGRGRWIDCALYEMIVRMLGRELVNYGRSGVIPQREGGMPLSDGPTSAPHTFTYQTRDGHWVSTYVALDKHFQTLAEMIRDPVLNRPELATRAGRLAHGDLLDSAIRKWIANTDLHELTDLMDRAGLPFSPVNSVADIISSPQVKARENLVTMQTLEGEEILVPDAYPRLDRGTTNIRWAGEPLGASNKDVYCGLVGLSATELSALSAEGII